MAPRPFCSGRGVLVLMAGEPLPRVRIQDPQRLHARAPEAPAPKMPRPRRVALLVVHGMGQQVAFETIAQAAESLAARETPKAEVRVGELRVGDATLRRAEVEVGGAQAHVFEGYWAPITQGRVRARDAVAFLLGGAVAGLQKATKRFVRYRFGHATLERAGFSTVVALALASAVLASLLVLNALVLAVAGAAWAAPGWLPAHVVSDLTWLLLLFALGVVAAVAWIGAASGARRLRGRAPRPMVAVAWIMVGLGAATTVASAVGSVAIVAYELLRPASGSVAPFMTAPPGWLLAGLWAFLLVVSLAAKKVFVEYVGDVAVYVSPHKLDRFNGIRQDIKRAVLAVAGPIYAARDDDGRFHYDEVVIMGHSLGSVVAYDTLNGLLREDALAEPGAARDVLSRTAMLLTFGSPLDKTAFVFATAAGAHTVTREALAALSQPLIQDVRYRSIRWVNVHAPADVISGRLDLYDHPEGVVRVENVVDEDATTPLLAHTEFWGNRLVWDTLRGALVGAARSVPVKDQEKEERAPSPALGVE